MEKKKKSHIWKSNRRTLKKENVGNEWKEQGHEGEHDDWNGMQVKRRKKDVDRMREEIATHDKEKGKDKEMGECKKRRKKQEETDHDINKMKEEKVEVKKGGSEMENTSALESWMLKLD